MMRIVLRKYNNNTEMSSELTSAYLITLNITSTAENSHLNRNNGSILFAQR